MYCRIFNLAANRSLFAFFFNPRTVLLDVYLNFRDVLLSLSKDVKENVN